MHANAKLQIFAPRACEHVSEYVPIPDRQRFGTTSGLRYFADGLATKIELSRSNNYNIFNCCDRYQTEYYYIKRILITSDMRNIVILVANHRRFRFWISPEPLVANRA